jgi:hypothetical protein
VDACPYDALRDGADFELSHTTRDEPMIDLMAIASLDRETEVTYIRRERDWAARAAAEGRIINPDRLLPMLPASIAGAGPGGGGNGHGNGHDHGNGNGHSHGAGGHAGHG